MGFQGQEDESGLRGPLEDLRSILIPAETLEAWAVQRRLFSLTRRRLLVAATSGRLVWITRKLLGGFDVANIRWQDLEDVTLRVGIFGANLLVRAGASTDLASEGAMGSRLHAFTGLRKAQAQAVYRICQAQDQAWREKRRIRELEELRARSGGFQITGGVGPGLGAAAGLGPAAGQGSAAGLAQATVGPGQAGTGPYAPPGGPASRGPGSQPAAAVPDAARRLQEAKKLLDDRLITDSEYEAIKARILGG